MSTGSLQMESKELLLVFHYEATVKLICFLHARLRKGQNILDSSFGPFYKQMFQKCGAAILNVAIFIQIDYLWVFEFWETVLDVFTIDGHLIEKTINHSIELRPYSQKCTHSCMKLLQEKMDNLLWR